jgi:hypothetical protein
MVPAKCPTTVLNSNRAYVSASLGVSLNFLLLNKKMYRSLPDVVQFSEFITVNGLRSLLAVATGSV